MPDVQLAFIEVDGIRVEAEKAAEAVTRCVAAIMEISRIKATGSEPLLGLDRVDSILKGKRLDAEADSH